MFTPSTGKKSEPCRVTVMAELMTASGASATGGCGVGTTVIPPFSRVGAGTVVVGGVGRAMGPSFWANTLEVNQQRQTNRLNFFIAVFCCCGQRKIIPAAMQECFSVDRVYLSLAKP